MVRAEKTSGGGKTTQYEKLKARLTKKRTELLKRLAEINKALGIGAEISTVQPPNKRKKAQKLAAPQANLPEVLRKKLDQLQARSAMNSYQFNVDDASILVETARLFDLDKKSYATSSTKDTLENIIAGRDPVMKSAAVIQTTEQQIPNQWPDGALKMLMRAYPDGTEPSYNTLEFHMNKPIEYYGLNNPHYAVDVLIMLIMGLAAKQNIKEHGKDLDRKYTQEINILTESVGISELKDLVTIVLNLLNTPIKTAPKWQQED